MDSGNDSIDNVAVLMEEGCFFIIKRNLRRESRDGWNEMAKEHCCNITSPWEGKTVYIGSDRKNAISSESQKEFTLRAGERTIDKYGQYFLIPDIEVNTWWTNLGLCDQDIIDLYHVHGKCEQFHSEIKIDMDAERLPYGLTDFIRGFPGRSRVPRRNRRYPASVIILLFESDVYGSLRHNV